MAKFKLISSLEKILPEDHRSIDELQSISKATALKGEVYSFQMVYGEEIMPRAYVSFDIKSDLQVRANGVEFVPCTLPGGDKTGDFNYITKSSALLPDLLSELPEQGILMHANQKRTLWFTVRIPDDAQAGVYPITLHLQSKDCATDTTLTLQLEVLNARLPQQALIHTQWFHCDCIASYYGVEVFSPAHWALIEKFMAAAVECGINMLLTPIFTPPLDTAIGGGRPTVQLVKIAFKNGAYRFDFTDLKRWVDLCHKVGIRYFEMAHLFTQWGAEFTPKIVVETENGPEKRFGWHVAADSAEYRGFLAQFLPALTAFLKAEGIAEQTYFHISDEPRYEKHYQSYRTAYEMVAPYLQGFHRMDALSDYEFYETGLVETPIPANNHIAPFIEHQIQPLWTYYCTAQHKDVSNRFMAMPSARTRIMGAQMFKYKIAGFLQWGFNFYYSVHSRWLINPFITTDADGAFQSGDAFVVYPGQQGPLHSIRGKVFFEALQDMRALQLLEQYIGHAATVELIDRVAGMELTFENYPCSPQFFTDLRNAIYEELKKHI